MRTEYKMHEYLDFRNDFKKYLPGVPFSRRIIDNVLSEFENKIVLNTVFLEDVIREALNIPNDEEISERDLIQREFGSNAVEWVCKVGCIDLNAQMVI